jgi:pyridoxine/pyridoxamine 5'-phosphate oxidase
MSQDRDYFRRRAAEARAAACSKEQTEKVAVAGELALAYAALARRQASAVAAVDAPAIPLESA